MLILNFPLINRGKGAAPMTWRRIDFEHAEDRLDAPSVGRTFMDEVMKGCHSRYQLRSR